MVRPLALLYVSAQKGLLVRDEVLVVVYRLSADDPRNRDVFPKNETNQN